MNCPNCNSSSIRNSGRHYRCKQCLHSWYLASDSVHFPAFPPEPPLPITAAVKVVGQTTERVVEKPIKTNTHKFFCHDHQGKASSYIKALESFGYKRIEDYPEAMFMLVDSDVVGRQKQIERFWKGSKGGKVFIYPHTARPMILWDGIYRPSPHVSAVFGIGQGWVDVLKAINYPRPVHPVGWPYGRLRKFRRKVNFKNVLFAPIHPNGNGYLSEQQKETNRRSFEKLERLAVDSKINLTVRYLHKLEWGGFGKSRSRKINWVQGQPDQSTREIDEADVVVSKQNMQYMAVARGCPTVGMGENQTPIVGTTLQNTRHVSSWPNYRDLMKFPIDILEDRDAYEILKEASSQESLVENWKERMIGGDFDGEKFVKILESYL